jgi:diadenosine tetraphosphate (Ap4A) HIT family hydrolase
LPSEHCHTCELIAARDAGSAPPWDCIVRTDHWDIVHASDTSLLGWMCLVVRRHIASVDELTDAEANELGPLLRDVSLFLKCDLGCLKTYVMQFAEHPDHPHVHFHVVPRAPDMPAEHRGANVFAYLSVEDSERVTEPDMNALASRLREQFRTGRSLA